MFGGILQTGRCHEIADDLLDEGPRGWLIVVWRGNAVRAETFQPSAETFQPHAHPESCAEPIKTCHAR